MTRRGQLGGSSAAGLNAGVTETTHGHGESQYDSLVRTFSLGQALFLGSVILKTCVSFNHFSFLAFGRDA